MSEELRRLMRTVGAKHSSGLGSTPLERHLSGSPRGLAVTAGRPPADGLRARVVVRDAGGLDCEAATYPLAALRGMDASVWATHAEGGSLQLTDRGQDTRVAGVLWARFRRGEELVLTATGPEARQALAVCRRMLEASPEDRRELYREHQRERKNA